MEAGREEFRDQAHTDARRRAEALSAASDFRLEGEDRDLTVEALASLLLFADSLAALPLEGVAPALTSARWK
jgi:hypothetical protein